MIDFDPNGGFYYVTSEGQNDIFILKLDSLGNFVWVKIIEGTEGSLTGYGNSVSLDNNSNVYVTGSFLGTADFDPGNGTHIKSSFGNSDAFVLKLDSAGNFSWVKQLEV